MTATDPEAPYGRHEDGTPKRSNGGRPRGTARPGGSTRPTGKAGRAKASAPPRKATPNPAPKSAKDEPIDYRPAFSNLVSIFGVVLTPVSPLDAYVVLTCADEAGIVGHDLAQINKYVRQIGDKALAVGPYSGAVTLLTRVFAQVAENHAWAPAAVTTKFGAIPRDQLAHHIRQQQAAADTAARQAQQEQHPEQHGYGPAPANDVPPFAYDVPIDFGEEFDATSRVA